MIPEVRVHSSIRSIALAVVLSAVAGMAFASPAEDAKALIAQGQYGEALTKLDRHLSDNPQDAGARFSRGVALVKLNRTNEAIKAFADLTRDFPQLPEPYNNLAVIYAQQGEYEKARNALEAALAAHPSYATAHENLGDVYAALAGASYNRALLIDQGNQGLRNKIATLAKIDHSPVLAAVPTPAAAEAPPAKSTRKSKKAEAKAVEPEKAAAEATPTDSNEGGAVDAKTRAAVSDAVVAWTRAWSSKDLAAYFAAYAEDFAPEGGLALEDWQQQRKDRILKPSRIQVEARNVEISKLGDSQVRVKFVQQYESDTFTDSVSKIIELKRVDDAWKIVREYAR